MEIHLSPEQSSQFAQIAAIEGRDVSVLTAEALDRYLSEEARYIAAVREGEAAIARGDVLSHEEVGKRLEQWLKL